MNIDNLKVNGKRLRTAVQGMAQIFVELGTNLYYY